MAFGDADISIILLEGLGEDAIEYSKKVRDSNSRFNQISEEELNKLCKYTNGHPLAIKLAIPLMAKGSLADNILETIIKFSAQEGIEELTERIFTNSYNHSTDQEKLLLQKVSVFSDKFRRDAILNIFDNEDIEIPLYGLLDNLLITHLEEFYEIHPLVRIFSYDLLENKEKVHAKAADYFIIQRTENLNPALEAEIFYHLEKSGQWERVESEIEQKGRQFIMIGQLGLIKEYVEKLNLVNIENSIFDIYYGDIYEILGEYKNAKQHFKNASLQDKEPKIKVEGLIKYGEMIFRSGDVKEASDIFEKAYYFSKTNGYLKEEGRALNDIGLIHQNEGELHEAELKHKEAYKIALLADDNQGIVQALINTCSALKSTGKWQEALSYIQKSIEIGERTNDKPGIILSLNHLGSLYFITDLVKSYKTFEQALEIAKEIGDKVGIAESISGIGSVLGKRKEWNKAIQEIKYSIAIAEEIGYNYIIATFLNDLANVYQDKGDWENAIKNYEKSLHIHELEGNKCDLVISHSNIGFAYLDRQMYGDAIVAYLKSLSFTSQMKSNRVNSLNKLNQIREIIGLEEFRKLARAEYSKMSFDKKQLIPIESICKEPRIAGDKLERNDPCYCGSGKKFKKCHGKNE